MKLGKYSLYLEFNELSVSDTQSRKRQQKVVGTVEGLQRSYFLENAFFFLHHFLHKLFLTFHELTVSLRSN